MDSPSDTWDLGSLPFQVGHQPTSSNSPLPDLLPFTLAVDHSTGLIVQHPDAVVSRNLTNAYRLGSQMGTPLREVGIGSAQLEDLVWFIGESVNASDLHGIDALEIGCGSGALLVRLAELGADVVGVEPGEAAAQAARERGLRVRCEPFSRESFDSESFDLIVHHCVLEHIERPREFIAEQLPLLSSGGRIVCCVPDCTPALAHGDLSILAHEHWSYFEAHTLEHLAASVGAVTLTSRLATTEGSIYSAWEAGPSVAHPAPTPPPYLKLARGTLRAVEEYMLAAAQTDSTLGIFPGARFINYLALAQARLEAMPAIRWFDDDPAAYGRFYPPIAIPIEARAALLARPVDQLLITSWTFGALLREQLATEPALASTQIHVLADLL